MLANIFVRVSSRQKSLYPTHPPTPKNVGRIISEYMNREKKYHTFCANLL
jgi:hypothetical protein